MMLSKYFRSLSKYSTYYVPNLYLLFRIQSENLSVVEWTAMIAAYVHHEKAKEALALYSQMQLVGVKPNDITFISALSACALTASLKLGESIHADLIQHKFLRTPNLQ